MRTEIVDLRPLSKACFVRKDLQRQANKAKGTEQEDGDAGAAIITALDIEDGWKKSAEGEHILSTQKL